ncbi:MAG: hypothetical protein NW224_26155 [Leptolyngbyaceae cyanobacterium bins.302]|nr:hypothetical protein [Leptolyngbyaceae cyanobacterium bins.302]
MPQDANQRFNSEDADPDLTDEDFAAMEANLAAMEDHLFHAGVAILQAAKTQEEIFTTSIDAIQEALEPGSTESNSSVKAIPDQFFTSPNQTISLETIWERLNTIEQRLEFLIEHLIPAAKTMPATKTKAQKNTDPKVLESTHESDSEWTEKSLKKAYKTLAIVRSELGIEAKNWKLAVTEANAVRSQDSKL